METPKQPGYWLLSKLTVRPLLLKTTPTQLSDDGEAKLVPA